MKQKTLTVEKPLEILELMASIFPDEVVHAIHCPFTGGTEILPVLHKTEYDGHRWVLYLDYDGITDYLVYDSFTGSMTHEVYNPVVEWSAVAAKIFPAKRKFRKREKIRKGK